MNVGGGGMVDRRSMCIVVALSLLVLGVPAPVLAQGKTRIAVTAFDNKVKGPIPNSSWKLGEGLAEILTTELMRTGQFIVVERQGLGDVVREQELGQSGLIRGETAARTGELLGAQIVVRGAVTQFEEAMAGGGLDVGVPGRVGVGGRAQVAQVAIDIRLIDAGSGQVLASHGVAKAVPAGGGGFSARAGNVNFGGDGFYQTPIGQATRAAIQEALQFITASVARVPAVTSFSIVKVEDGLAYVSAGAGSVRVGDVLSVFSRGDELVDPDSGLKLGNAERLIGSIQITEVQERFSVATIRSGGGGMKRGDRVKPR